MEEANRRSGIAEERQELSALSPESCHRNSGYSYSPSLSREEKLNHMDKDFTVGQANELIKGDVIYDLHNCFDFDGLMIRGNAQCCLAFKPIINFRDTHPSIIIFAKAVDRFVVSDNFGSATITHLEEIGYKSFDDDDDNWIASSIPSDESRRSILSFQ